MDEKIIIGVDEVGRGAWAGPLVVGAVAMTKKIKGLSDSKLVSKQNRKKLAALIREYATGYSTGWVEPSEVDRLGLTAATTLAIERALRAFKIYDQIIIDGSINFLKSNPKAICLIKADSLIPAVSAASILAKVARDEYMTEQAFKYPQYGFNKHVGYGTAFHKQAIVEHGITPLHRRSYKTLLNIAV